MAGRPRAIPREAIGRSMPIRGGEAYANVRRTVHSTVTSPYRASLRDQVKDNKRLLADGMITEAEYKRRKRDIVAKVRERRRHQADSEREAMTLETASVFTAPTADSGAPSLGSAMPSAYTASVNSRGSGGGGGGRLGRRDSSGGKHKNSIKKKKGKDKSTEKKGKMRGGGSAWGGRGRGYSSDDDSDGGGGRRARHNAATRRKRREQSFRDDFGGASRSEGGGFNVADARAVSHHHLHHRSSGGGGGGGGGGYTRDSRRPAERGRSNKENGVSSSRPRRGRGAPDDSVEKQLQRRDHVLDDTVAHASHKAMRGVNPRYLQDQAHTTNDMERGRPLFDMGRQYHGNTALELELLRAENTRLREQLLTRTQQVIALERQLTEREREFAASAARQQQQFQQQQRWASTRGGGTDAYGGGGGSGGGGGGGGGAGGGDGNHKKRKHHSHHHKGAGAFLSGAEEAAALDAIEAAEAGVTVESPRTARRLLESYRLAVAKLKGDNEALKIKLLRSASKPKKQQGKKKKAKNVAKGGGDDDDSAAAATMSRKKKGRRDRAAAAFPADEESLRMLLGMPSATLETTNLTPGAQLGCVLEENVTNGVSVIRVHKLLPNAQPGFQEGDIVASVNGRSVVGNDLSYFAALVKPAEHGRRKLQLLRPPVDLLVGDSTVGSAAGSGGGGPGGGAPNAGSGARGPGNGGGGSGGPGGGASVGTASVMSLPPATASVVSLPPATASVASSLPSHPRQPQQQHQPGPPAAAAAPVAEPPLRVQCPNCNTELQVPLGGEKTGFRCGRCASALTVAKVKEQLEAQRRQQQQHQQPSPRQGRPKSEATVTFGRRVVHI